MLNFTFSRPLIVFFIALLIPFNPVLAKEYQSIQSIKKTITQFIRNNIDTTQDYEIEVKNIDSRLKLPKCSIPIEAYSRKTTLKAGVLSIGVRCKGKKTWGLYNSAKLSIYKSVLVLKQSLRRNTLIAKDHIAYERKPINKLSRGFFTNFSQIKGSINSRNLQAGIILRPSQFITQKLIKKGDKVTILAKSKSFRIRMSGHALMDGRLGDIIRVKNSRSKKIIEGTVIDSGVISVN